MIIIGVDYEVPLTFISSVVQNKFNSAFTTGIIPAEV
jgi:hypothetical protein